MGERGSGLVGGGGDAGEGIIGFIIMSNVTVEPEVSHRGEKVFQTRVFISRAGNDLTLRG